MQGFNRYYPPDYDPKDARHKGNLNRLAGKAPQKPVVRFEMPFNVWCLHCDSHIAQGVRFNAEKKKTGNYFTSPIYSFTMKCHLCTKLIVITTNPKETCYDVTSGAKKKTEEWNAKESGTFEFSYDQGRDDSIDPIYKLELDATKKLNVKDAQSHISKLKDLNERQWSDPFAQSQRLRKSFRTEKKRLIQEKVAKEKIGDTFGLHIDLLDPSERDTIRAKDVDFAGHAGRERSCRRQIAVDGPWFNTHKGRIAGGNIQMNADRMIAKVMPESESGRQRTLGKREDIHGVSSACNVKNNIKSAEKRQTGLVDYQSDEEGD